MKLNRALNYSFQVRYSATAKAEAIEYLKAKLKQSEDWCVNMDRIQVSFTVSEAHPQEALSDPEEFDAVLVITGYEQSLSDGQRFWKERKSFQFDREDLDFEDAVFKDRTEIGDLFSYLYDDCLDAFVNEEWKV